MSGKERSWTVLSGLGTEEYANLHYEWPPGNEERESIYAEYPLSAVLQASGAAQSVERIVVLASAAAWEKHEACLRAVLEHRFHIDCDECLKHETVDFHEARATTHLVEVVSRAVKGAERVLYDVSGGPRQLPLIFLSSLAYHRAVRGDLDVSIWFAQRGAQRGDSRGQLFDLSELHHFEALARSTREFERHGRVDELRDFLLSARRPHSGEPDSTDFPDRLRRAADYLGNALALDTAEVDAEELLKAGAARCSDLPLARELLDRIRQRLTPLMPGADRKHLVLDRAELDRQLAVVANALDRRDISGAVRLLREILVNRVLIAQGYTRPSEWLVFDPYRQRASKALHRWSRENPKSSIADVWARLWRMRNRYAHSGFDRCPSNSESDLSKLRRLRQDFEAILEDPGWSEVPAS